MTDRILSAIRQEIEAMEMQLVMLRKAEQALTNMPAPKTLKHAGWVVTVGNTIGMHKAEGFFFTNEGAAADFFHNAPRETQAGPPRGVAVYL